MDREVLDYKQILAYEIIQLVRQEGVVYWKYFFFFG